MRSADGLRVDQCGVCDRLAVAGKAVLVVSCPLWPFGHTARKSTPDLSVSVRSDPSSIGRRFIEGRDRP